MLWLYLLGIVTVLMIVLRRVLRRQKPLNDELYAKSVAVEHVQSGVAWVRADGTFGSANLSFVQSLGLGADDLIGREWCKMFPVDDHLRAQQAFSQMLLRGVTSFDAVCRRPDGASVYLNVRLVAVHDHHMRFVGHHVLIENRTREHELEAQLKQAIAEAREQAGRGPRLAARR
jgi:PAS domain S-box-containing protein